MNKINVYLFELPRSSIARSCRPWLSDMDTDWAALGKGKGAVAAETSGKETAGALAEVEWRVFRGSMGSEGGELPKRSSNELGVYRQNMEMTYILHFLTIFPAKKD